LSAGERRAEAHHLEHVAAVGGARHHDLDRHVLETDDPIDPLAAEHPGLAAIEAEQRNWNLQTNARAKMLAGVGHTPMTEGPDETAELILDFASTISVA